MKNFISPLIAAILFFASCSSESSDNSKLIDSPKIALVDSAEIFIVPAPLQITTFFKQHSVEFQTTFLSDKSVMASTYTTDYYRALNLGISLVDAGYAALYDNRQTAIDYLARVEELATSLRLEPVALKYSERMKSNVGSPDSLSYLILLMYNEAQQNLNEGKREKTAFYIGAGCYLEGLALTTQYEELKAKNEFNQLLAQQKMWLDNLTEAITYLEPDEESQDLFNTFFTLQDCFREIPLTTENNILSCTYNEGSFARLKKKTIQLRDAVVSNK